MYNYKAQKVFGRIKGPSVPILDGRTVNMVKVHEVVLSRQPLAIMSKLGHMHVLFLPNIPSPFNTDARAPVIDFRSRRLTAAYI